MFDFCRTHGLPVYAISWNPARALVRDGAFIAENRPKPLRNPRGVIYHANQVWYGLSLMISALRFGADTAVVVSGATHWFVLSLLTLARVKVIPCIHNTFWPSGYPQAQGMSSRVVRALDAWFWRHCAEATLCVSPECQRQVEAITGGRNGPIFQFRGQFYPDDFLAVAPPPPHDERPFRVIFVGRVVREKGIFDLVEIADRLEGKYPGRLRYEVCGSGSDLDELKEAIEGRGLRDIVKVMGRVSRSDLLGAYGRSHVLIIPTLHDFCEGMPATAAEAVLCGRPVLTSRLSNALDVLEGAVIEARPDDPDSYIEGLERLMNDGAYYRQCCEACPALQAQFYDRDRGFTAALGRALRLPDAEPVVVSRPAQGGGT
jgi:glycosyltransferase involved in cell wall biosynthesis